MTFTGFILEDLRRDGTPDQHLLLEYTDLLVDGRFEKDAIDHDRPWVGSRNQRFHALSDRYADLVKDLTPGSDRVEVRIGPDGQLTVNGWATTADLELLLGGLGRRRSGGRSF